MTSPAERYQAAQARNRYEKTRLHQFEQTLGFELDEFQRESCTSLEAGRGVDEAKLFGMRN